MIKYTEVQKRELLLNTVFLSILNHLAHRYRTAVERYSTATNSKGKGGKK